MPRQAANVCYQSVFALCGIGCMHSGFGAPNILFIVADDYGFADVGYHGSPIRTPNLDKLAAGGVKLENYYVQPLCTPTRAAFMTGRFPINIGLQSGVIENRDPFGMTPHVTTLALALRAAGYSTHAIGKWHLGFCNEKFLPTRRGFDTFYGFYTSEGDYFTHKAGEFFDYHKTCLDSSVCDESQWGSNKEDGGLLNIAPSKSGIYSTHDLRHQVEKLIHIHPTGHGSKPLFVYLAFQAVHGPLQAPQQYVDEYTSSMGDRATYAGMVTAMDEAIGNVTNAFKMKDSDGAFWQNTFVVFTTDNGGMMAKDGGTKGNNYPLRGGKPTLWEGGTRGVAFVHGYGLKKIGGESQQMMHAVDWLPTLLHESRELLPKRMKESLSDIDGLDMWDVLMNDKDSPRTEFVYNIDPGGKSTTDIFSGAVRSGCYKLLVGQHSDQGYSSKSGLPHLQSAASELTEEASIDGPLLFNICADPSEIQNIYGNASLRQEQKYLEELIEKYRLGMVPALRYTAPSGENTKSLLNESWAPWGCKIDDMFPWSEPKARDSELRSKFLRRKISRVD